MDNFVLQGNVLTANTDLYWETHAEFRSQCEVLTNSEFHEIVIDLSCVSFIFSAYMGTIGKVLADSAKKKKHLTIRISDNLSWLFELVGFEKLINIEVVS